MTLAPSGSSGRTFRDGDRDTHGIRWRRHYLDGWLLYVECLDCGESPMHHLAQADLHGAYGMRACPAAVAAAQKETTP